MGGNVIIGFGRTSSPSKTFQATPFKARGRSLSLRKEREKVAGMRGKGSKGRKDEELWNNGVEIGVWDSGVWSRGGLVTFGDLFT